MHRRATKTCSQWQGMTWKIYTCLINYLLAKCGGALNLHCLTSHDCVCSPILRILFLLKNDACMYLRIELEKFPLLPTPLERLWMDATITHPHLTAPRSLKILYKLLLHHITHLSQLTLPGGTQLMDPHDFKNYYNTPSKLIKIALLTLEMFVCQPKCTPHCLHQCCIHHPHVRYYHSLSLSIT
jgi:hypothetical protein